MSETTGLIEDDETPTSKTIPFQLNMADARAYLKAITGKDNPAVRIRLVYERHKKSAPEEWKEQRPSHPSIEIAGTITALQVQIEQHQAEGYAVYLVFNVGKPKGDCIRDNEITALRGFFTDEDGMPRPVSRHLEPNFFVERDDTHRQAYWIAPTKDVSQFKPTQLRLAALYGSDSAVCNPSRIIRLAGGWHQKGDNPLQIRFVPNTQCLVDSIGIQYTPEDVLRDLPQIDIADCQRRAAASGVEFDKAAAIRKHRSYLNDLAKQGQFAVSGAEGNPFTFKIMCKGKDWGLSPETLLDETLASDWNAGCSPPWGRDELTVLIMSAFRNGQNDPGSDAPKDAREQFKEYLEKPAVAAIEEDPEHEAPKQQVDWDFYDAVADDSLAPFKYRDGRKLWIDSPDGEIVQTVGPPKGFKTDLVMHEKFRLAKKGKARVAMLALEGEYGVRKVRLNKLARYHDVPLEDLKDKCFFRIISMGDNPMFDLSNVQNIEYAAKFCRANNLTDLIIDTQHRASGRLDENSANDARTLWNNLGQLKKKGKVNIDVIHHQAGKPGSGPQPKPGVVKWGRGSSADFGAVDQLNNTSFDPGDGIVRFVVVGRKNGPSGIVATYNVTFPFKDEAKFPDLTPEQREEPILVMMSEAEMEALANDPFSPMSVASALADMECHGKERRVVSAVVVEHILRLRQMLPPAKKAQDDAIKAGVKTLTSRAKKETGARGLRAYGEKSGPGKTAPWLWGLPEDEDMLEDAQW